MKDQRNELQPEPITWRSLLNYAVLIGTGIAVGRGTISADEAEVITGAVIGIGSIAVRLIAKKRGIKVRKPNQI